MAEKKKTIIDMIGAQVGDVSIAAMDAGASAGKQRNGMPAGAAGDAASNSDTRREQIEYIDVERLIPNEKNFYSLDGIEELADNIELIGLQQPLRVRPLADGSGNFSIESGHRRRAAIKLLTDAGKDQFRSVACIVERRNESEAMRELRLIYANAATRKMTDADLAKQAERVTELLYRLKEEGVEFPAGRMRDLVAEACKVSATKIATLKVIEEKLPAQYRTAWDAGKMTTDAAYKLAKAPAELQARICKAYPKAAPDARAMDRLTGVRKERKGCLWEPSLKCPDGSACTHGDAFLRHDASCYAYDHCGGKTCCLKCDRATRDWSPCGSACVKAKQVRTEKQKADRQKKEERQEKELGRTHKAIAKHLQRLIPLIDAAGLTDHDRLTFRYTSYSVGTLRACANGDFSAAKGVLHESAFAAAVLQGYQLIPLARTLNCTTDYLLGLADEPQPATNLPTSANCTEDAAPQWRTGTPPKEGRYWCTFMDAYLHDTITSTAYWGGAYWYREEGGAKISSGVERWYSLPEDDA